MKIVYPLFVAIIIMLFPPFVGVAAVQKSSACKFYAGVLTYEAETYFVTSKPKAYSPFRMILRSSAALKSAPLNQGVCVEVLKATRVGGVFIAETYALIKTLPSVEQLKKGGDQPCSRKLPK